MSDPDDGAYLTSYVGISETQLLRMIAAALNPDLLALRHLTEVVRSSSGWILVLEPDLLELSRRHK